MNKQLTNLQKPLPMRRKQFSMIWGIALLFLAFNFSTVAANVKMLSEKVQLRVENVSIKDALKEIERQCEFTFLYNDASINVNQTITVSSKEQTVEELLDKILKNNGINYTFIDNQIVLTKAAGKQADKRTVKGKVSDSETNEGLPGVSILEKGTSNGTVSDLNGDFTITVAENAVIVLSSVGYVSEEMQVQNRTEFNMAMVPDIISLGDVVVIGYGSVKKSDLTGSVSSVSEESLSKTRSADFNQALQGKAAGVNVVSQTGSPGQGTTVRIRGIGTTTNSDPLFVVDGVQLTANDMNFLDPSDIESVSILKDASASAIYGSKGANGVVLITTKKGKSGENKVNFEYYRGAQYLSKKIDMMDGPEFMATYDKIHWPNGGGTDFPSGEVWANTDWQDEIFRTGIVQNTYLSTSGGNDHSTYSVSASYYQEQGIVRNTDFDRLNLRVNSEHKIKKLTIGENILLNHSIQHRVTENNEYNSAVANAVGTDPVTPVYDFNENGDYTWADTRFSDFRNPVSFIELVDDKYIRNRLIGSVFAELELIKGLKIKSQVGINYDNNRYNYFRPEFYINSAYNDPHSDLTNTIFETYYWNWENTATYNAKFGEHNLTILAGMTSEENYYRPTTFTNTEGPGAENQVKELRYYLYYSDNTGASISDYDGEGQSGPYDNTMISYLGRVNYSFKDRYLVTLSVRRDGSSKFGDQYDKNMWNNGRWGTFPSLALAWRISDESFFANVPYVSSLKLRYGWGKTGNQNIGAYRYSTTMNKNIAAYVFDESTEEKMIGVFPYDAANGSIHWETTKQTNCGFDAGFFDNKFSLSLDYFIRKTEDMLGVIPIPAIVGVGNPPYQNLASVTNKGFELTLGYKQKSGEFNYSVDANASYIKNKVTGLGEANIEIDKGDFADNDVAYVRIKEGWPIGAFIGYKTDGLFQNWDEVNAGVQPAARPGDVRYVDVNNDGAITSNDIVMIGNPQPDYVFGLTGQIGFKGIDFTVILQGVYGNQILYAYKRWIFDGSGGGRNLHTDMLDAWTPENTDTDIPRLGGAASNLDYSDMYIYDGSYLRLKTVELGYTLPSKLLKRIGLDNVRIYVNGKNLYTFTNYIGFDPEIGLDTSIPNEQMEYGIDKGTYPVAAMYMGGIQISF
jgi:TonB-linked SusC/RagA family outer membrane protein